MRRIRTGVFILSVGLLSLSTAFAQTPASSPQPPAAAKPKPELTPEARGDIFMARKMFREASEVYQTIKPATATILNKIGIAYHQMSDLRTAARYYQRAAKVQPSYAEAVNNLGTVYYSQKNYRRAISTYKRALKLSPDSASMLSNLGTAYFARKDYKTAMEYYQKAMELDPEVFERRGGQGVLLQERSVDERARFHYFMAKSYAKAGRNDLAMLYIRRSLEEGFKERAKYMEENEFAELRKLPEFEELMKLEPRVL